MALLLASFSASAMAQEGRIVLEDLGLGGSPTYGSANGGYGTSICVVGDLDGDGWQDVAVGHPQWVTGSSGGGRVRLLSGRTGVWLRDVTSSQSGVGTVVAGPGDVDGDLIPDVLSLNSTNSFGPVAGDIQLYSGATGSVLLSLGVIATSVATPGDWNGDGVPDIAYVQSSNVRVVSGSSGAFLAAVGSGGYSEVVAIGAPGIGPRRLAVRANNTVSLINSNGSSAWSVVGYDDMANGGDVNGDTVYDVVAIAQGGAVVDVLSGVDGSVLRTVPGGSVAAGGADVDGDGLGDIVVGDPTGRGRIRVWSGANGAQLYGREGEEFGERFGEAVAMHPGAGASMRAAALVGAPYRFDGSVEVGAVQAIADALPGELDGSFRPYGQSCNYTSTHLRPGAGRPTAGQSYVFRSDNNTSPVGFEMLALGLSRTTWNGIPLPVVLLPLGLSCQLYVSIDLTVAGNPFSPYQSVAILATPGLAGLVVYVQGWNVSGFPVLEASDAATLVIGN